MSTMSIQSILDSIQAFQSIQSIQYIQRDGERQSLISLGVPAEKMKIHENVLLYLF